MTPEKKWSQIEGAIRSTVKVPKQGAAILIEFLKDLRDRKGGSLGKCPNEGQVQQLREMVEDLSESVVNLKRRLEALEPETDPETEPEA